MTEVPYCTREMVQDETGYLDTVAQNRRIDRAILAASRDLERYLHRTFYPQYGTRSFDIPDEGTLWLHEHELAEAPDAIVSGDTTMTTGDYILRPESGPPYRWIDIDYSGNTFWESVDTTQNAIAITGTYGYPVTESVATFTAVSALSTGTVQVDDSSAVGVGHLMRIGSELMLVTEKTLIASGTTLSADVAANKGAATLTVSSGTLLHEGERILIDGEWMRIETIAGNTVIVTRAMNGSVLTTHTSGNAVWAPRVLRCERGILGTTASAQNSGVDVYTVSPPSLVVQATMARAIVNLEQGSAGYMRTIGSGETAREAAGRGLRDIWEEVYTAYGRKTRSRAVTG